MEQPPPSSPADEPQSPPADDDAEGAEQAPFQYEPPNSPPSFTFIQGIDSLTCRGGGTCGNLDDVKFKIKTHVHSRAKNLEEFILFAGVVLHYLVRWAALVKRCVSPFDVNNSAEKRIPTRQREAAENAVRQMFEDVAERRCARLPCAQRRDRLA